MDRIATKAISERQRELARGDASEEFAFAAESAAYEAAKKKILNDKKTYGTKGHMQEALKDLSVVRLIGTWARVPQRRLWLLLVDVTRLDGCGPSAVFS